VIWGTASWGDFDNDGWVDILLVGSLTFGTSGIVPSARIYHNQHDGTFSDIQAGLIGTYYSATAWADFDNDGDLDVVISGQDTESTTRTTLYRNNWGIENSLPSAPTDLAAVVQGRDVTLSWTRSTDAETIPPLGLSYNLQVGLATNETRVVSPHANAATGFRRLAQRGNVDGVNRWTLKNLLPGDYIWSVQAIDTALAGSAFATTGTFSIANRPPTALSQTQLLTEDMAVVITLTAFDIDGQPLSYLITAPPTNGVLTGNAPVLTYQPATNYFGTDSFAFLVNDGMANSEPALVSLTITAVSDVDSVRLTLRAAPNGAFQLSLRGEPYQRYRLEASEDLLSWTALTTLQASPTGELMFADGTTGLRQRFYRPRIVE